jgi:hypothetical protein
VFAGSIILEFQMSREKADELVKHLQDPNSWLLTKGLAWDNDVITIAISHGF